MAGWFRFFAGAQNEGEMKNVRLTPRCRSTTLTAAIAVVVTAAAPHRINEFVVRLISIIVVVVVIFGGPSVSHTVFLFIFHPTSFVCAGSLRFVYI